MPLDNALDNIKLRLKALEDEKLVRQCMNRYMQLCDVLGVGFDLEPLVSLFTQEAVWEGKGNRYIKTFGRFEGRTAITAMFEKYTKKPAHFALNVHFLANELIEVDGTKASGNWVLIQPSTFADGKSQLSCARITANFREVNNTWQISHFQTMNLFSRPIDKPWDNAALLPVPD